MLYNISEPEVMCRQSGKIPKSRRRVLTDLLSPDFRACLKFCTKVNVCFLVPADTTHSPTDLLALLSQGAQSVHDLLSLGCIYKTSTEGWDAHTRHRVRQDLHRWSYSTLFHCSKSFLLRFFFTIDETLAWVVYAHFVSDCYFYSKDKMFYGSITFLSTKA